MASGMKLDGTRDAPIAAGHRSKGSNASSQGSGGFGPVRPVELLSHQKDREEDKRRNVDEMSRMLDEMIVDRVDNGHLRKGSPVRLATPSIADGTSQGSAQSEQDIIPELDNRISRYSVASKAESHAFSESSGSFWSALSFLANTRNSISTYASTLSRRRSTREPVINLNTESNFDKQIREAGLAPLDDLDWSGQGQFVEFGAGETIPLQHRRDISSTSGAIIDEVMCRRIRLARKTMICRPESRLKSALEEIKHLQRLDYSHIVRFVGAYVEGVTISMLIYPVAECDLEIFLRTFKYSSGQEYFTQGWDLFLGPSYPVGPFYGQALLKKLSIVKMPSCLIHALAFVHNNSIRHLDVKPKNILVRTDFHFWNGTHAGLGDIGDIMISRNTSPPHKVYLCDFGISTSFNFEHDTKTTSPTARTETYCAPEIDDDEAYSRAADVFSLSCVFTELFTCAVGGTLEDFADARAGIAPGASGFKKNRSDRSFHANLERVDSWIGTLAASPKTSDLDLLALDLVFTDFNANKFSTRGSIHVFGDSVRRDRSEIGLETLHLEHSYPLCLDVFESGENMYFVDILMLMLRRDPNLRPTSALLSSKAKRLSCCERGGKAFIQD